MLRWFIIFSLIGYVLYKLGFFRALSSGYNEPLNRKQANNNNNINVNNTPPKEKKRPGSFKGGDYVDYEEIK
jgi:hypothetical protein